MRVKALLSAIFFNIFFSPAALAIALHDKTERLTLKASVRKAISKGQKLQIAPETFFNSEMSLAGDYFSGYLSDQNAKELGVPAGSKLIGSITKVKNAKSINRDGKLEVHVSELMLPDGDTVKVDASFESAEEKPIKNFAKEIAVDSAEVTAGALVGASDAFRYGGLYAAAATNGLSIAAGAALGAGLGLMGAVTKRGDIESADFGTSTLKLKDDFVFLEELPVLPQNLKAVSADLYGVDLKINSISKYFSNNYGDFLLFDVSVKNNTINKLFMSDFVLTSEHHVIPLLNNPLISNTDALISIDKKEDVHCKLAFSLAKFDKKEEYKLRLIDPITEKIIVDFNVDISSYI